MISQPAHVLCFGWNKLVAIGRIAQQRVAGSGGVPPSPKLPTLRSGNFGYTRDDVGRAEHNPGSGAAGDAVSVGLSVPSVEQVRVSAESRRVSENRRLLAFRIRAAVDGSRSGDGIVVLRI